jgi:hypothetical protein
LTIRVLAALTILLLALPAAAQQKKKFTASTSKGPPCSSTAHHAFDWWVGDWDVQTPKGTVAGENKVERILDGCAFRESWKAADGSEATSLTSYDAPGGRWTQAFVDSLGMVLILEGEVKEGKMTLSCTRYGPRGSSTLNRVTWQKVDADHLRQRWEQSTDEGRQWTLLFEGLYTRKKS